MNASDSKNSSPSGLPDTNPDPFPNWLDEVTMDTHPDLLLSCAVYSCLLLLQQWASHPLADGETIEFANWYEESFSHPQFDVVAALTYHEGAQWRCLRDPKRRRFHRQQAVELQKRLADSPIPDWVLKTLLGARKSAESVINLRKK